MNEHSTGNGKLKGKMIGTPNILIYGGSPIFQRESSIMCRGKDDNRDLGFKPYHWSNSGCSEFVIAFQGKRYFVHCNMLAK